jgi:hypothetical protein
MLRRQGLHESDYGQSTPVISNLVNAYLLKNIEVLAPKSAPVEERAHLITDIIAPEICISDITDIRARIQAYCDSAIFGSTKTDTNGVELGIRERLASSIVHWTDQQSAKSTEALASERASLLRASSDIPISTWTAALKSPFIQSSHPGRGWLPYSSNYLGNRRDNLSHTPEAVPINLAATAILMSDRLSYNKYLEEFIEYKNTNPENLDVNFKQAVLDTVLLNPSRAVLLRVLTPREAIWVLKVVGDKDGQANIDTTAHMLRIIAGREDYFSNILPLIHEEGGLENMELGKRSSVGFRAA